MDSSSQQRLDPVPAAGAARPAPASRQARDAAQQDLQDSEDRLAGAQEHYRLLAEQASDVIWTADLDGTVTYVSPAVERMLGYAPDEVHGREVETFLAPQDMRAPRRALQRAARRIRDGKMPPRPRTFELRARRRDGGLLWTETVVTLAPRPSGELGILGVTRNIHDRKELQRALARRQQALEIAFAIATQEEADLERILGNAARELAAFLGAPRVAVRVKGGPYLPRLVARVRDGELTDEDPRGARACALSQQARVEGCVHREDGDLAGQYPRVPCLREGTFRSFLGVPIQDHEGRTLGTICVLDRREGAFTDEEVQLVETLAGYLGAELERAGAQEAARDAEKGRALGRVAAGVAHEVRNPLNTLRITCDVLEQAVAEGRPPDRYLERIRTQIERLSALMRDLLEFRKPMEPRNYQRMDARTLCNDAAEAWAATEAARTHPLEAREEPGLGPLPIRVDRERIGQVIMNLLENAAQHSPDGAGIRLEIGVPTHEFARLRVVDAGPGIAKQDKSHVFDPFYTTRKGGTGLGLSIVKHILEHHAGGVALWNNEGGVGCTVEVSLPLLKESAT